VADSTIPTEARRGRAYARRAALALLARAFPGRVALAGATALLGGALPSVFAVLVGRLVGELSGPATGWGAATGTLAGIGAVLVATALVSSATYPVQADLYRRFDEHLTARLMSAVLRAPGLGLFEDPEMSSRRDAAAAIVRFGPGELVSGLMTKWTAQAGGFAAGVLVAATLSPSIALVLAVLWVAAGQILQASYYRANPFWTDPLRRAGYMRRLGLMPEWAKELRIFGISDWVIDRFGREWTQVMAELWQARRVGRLPLLILAGLIVAVHLGAVALVVHSILVGALSLGALTVLVQGLFGMASLASQDGDVWVENGAVPIPDLLGFERGLDRDRPRTASLRPASALPRREIRFEGVGFGYPGSSGLLFDRLDLTIPAGRSLAIVGLNGAGKTTLIKLLTGLRRPDRGRIAIDGEDLRELEPESWYRQVAAIFQDFQRYALTVRENVGFGAAEMMERPESEVLIRRALERAGARDLVDRLPLGLDTPLSRRFAGGVDLSGGQWQRIALARALMAVEAGARVLCLDEPTAQLDVRAEADLYGRFLELTRGLTTIVISHRFSTVRRADRIVVLDRGRIVEDGSHQELVAAAGTYARLFRRQAARYEAASDG
jgi:ATP-binding cassette subfamily B protein